LLETGGAWAAAGSLDRSRLLKTIKVNEAFTFPRLAQNSLNESNGFPLWLKCGGKMG
jgi:hypothetical protein